MNAPEASVVFPTRNRKEMLRKAIESVREQSVPVEIIVVDDGSDDSTEQMMRLEFPHVRYVRFDGGKGPSFLRNRGAEIASAPIIFSLDDDAWFATSRTIEQTLTEFSNPRVGAVAIPFVNVRRGPTVLQSAPDDSDQYVAHAFVGAAHAVRRDVFLALGGYRQHLYYMGEEGDLCLRMLAAGYVTRLGRADSVHHLESTNRVSERADFYGRQNDILFVWQNAPSRYLLPHLAGTILLGLRYAVNSAKYPLAMLRGTGSAFLHILRGEAMREPVALKAYGLYRRLKRSGPLRLKEIEAELPETLAV